MEGGGQHRQSGDPLSSPGMGQSSTAVAGQRQKTEAGNSDWVQGLQLGPLGKSESAKSNTAFETLFQCPLYNRQATELATSPTTEMLSSPGFLRDQ